MLQQLFVFNQDLCKKKKLQTLESSSKSDLMPFL